MGLNTVVIVGSVRSDRQGLKAAKFVERTLAARGHDVTIVDPARSWWRRVQPQHSALSNLLDYFLEEYLWSHEPGYSHESTKARNNATDWV